MKRHEHCKVLNRMISAPDGEWVKYEDVKKLKELNREMVEVLKELVDVVNDSTISKYIIDSFTTQPARRVLVKAEDGEGE